MIPASREVAVRQATSDRKNTITETAALEKDPSFYDSVLILSNEDLL
jgi:hypothetical protein